MADASELPALGDGRLDDIARDGYNAADPPTEAELRALCSELLRRRYNARKDSRRAEQVKKLRWMGENLLTKIEALAKQDADPEKTEEDDG